MQGYNKSINFEGKNINTIGDMYNIFKSCNFNDNCFELYLRNNLNIYSNFYVNNIKKQLNIIHYLQKNTENIELNTQVNKKKRI
jgi:phage-related protein